MASSLMPVIIGYVMAAVLYAFMLRDIVGDLRDR